MIRSGGVAVNPCSRGLTLSATHNGPMPALRRTLAAVLALLLAAAGCSPALDWRDWHAAEPGVSLMFPCKPVRQQRTLELEGRALRMVMEVCDAGDVSWALAYADAQDPAAVTALLRTLAGAAHVNLGAVPSAINPGAAPVPGATPSPAGGHFRIEGRLPDGQMVREELLVFAKGTWAVQVTALGRRLPAEAAATFIESVRAGR